MIFVYLLGIKIFMIYCVIDILDRVYCFFYMKDNGCILFFV